jgi:hypothetical protein
MAKEPVERWLGCPRPSISATTDQMARTIRIRMGPRSWGMSRRGKKRGAAGNVKEALHPRAGNGYGLVPEQPASTDPRAAHSSGRDDAGPLCLLGHIGQLSALKLVRPYGCKILIRGEEADSHGIDFTTF